VPPARKRQWKDLKKVGSLWKRARGGLDEDEEEYMLVSKVYQLVERLERRMTVEVGQLKELMEEYGDEISELKEMLQELEESENSPEDS
jgi:predicted nuclease with TOPRIM domain